MCCKGIFKRLAPFFLALAAGIFIASIFVDVSSPFGFRPRRMERWRENQQLRMENDQLRSENQCLRRQISARRLDSVDSRDEFTIPPVPAPHVDAPPPPPKLP